MILLAHQFLPSNITYSYHAIKSNLHCSQLATDQSKSFDFPEHSSDGSTYSQYPMGLSQASLDRTTHQENPIYANNFSARRNNRERQYSSHSNFNFSDFPFGAPEHQESTGHLRPRRGPSLNAPKSRWSVCVLPR